MEEENDLFLAAKNEQKLRRVVSDVSNEIDKIGKDMETIAKTEQVMQAECECCGLKEDCTTDYILKVKNSYCGRWVCGLCSEAVKERITKSPITAMEEAMSTHRHICQEYYNTTRLNPQLSFTCAMRNIAKRSSENRNSRNASTSKIARSISCVPRLDLNVK